MAAVKQAVRLLATFWIVGFARSQDGFSEQDLLRLQQLSSNDGHVETITSYSTNIVQRDPARNEHSVSSVNVQYHLSDELDKNHDYQRVNHGRSDRRKVFRIKNPFQRQLDPNDRQQDEGLTSNDGDAGASNQYASVQYSLPPEDFLQKMRAENQYIQQYSTPAPGIGYTATPQPQYYAKNPGPSYDNNPQQNQIPQMEQKIPQQQSYSSNSYQYLNSYENNQNAQQSANTYVSTPLPSNQYVGTPSNYVSSAAPVFLSSQPNLQQYVSSPLSVIQTGSPDYDNRITTTGSSGGYSAAYDNNEQTKRIQIDHYDNSANGIRYPVNVQQFGNEYPTSTAATPTSSQYPDPVHDSWQNNVNSNVNAISKSLQEVSLSQYRNNIYNGNAPTSQDGRLDQDNANADTHRVGNLAAANNMFMNYVQPDYQMYNIRGRTRDIPAIEAEVSQPGSGYSNGDYGWKLTDKKPLDAEEYQPGTYPGRYQSYAAAAPSSMNYYIDSGRPNYDPISKSATETQDGQEFARAAARAHEQMKQQQQQQIDKYNSAYYGNNNYAPSYTVNSNNGLTSNPAFPNVVTTYHGNIDRQKNKFYADSSNNNPVIYGNSQPDLITAFPYYLVNKDSVDGKSKQPFDHAKALKNIVPIDVSNVVGNSDSGIKNTGTPEPNRYNLNSYPKESIDQNIKQYYKPVTDAYYKDKNTGYGYNIKAKPEDPPANDPLKHIENNINYYNKQQAQESQYNPSLYYDSKRYGDVPNQQINYLAQPANNYPNNIQQVANMQRPNPLPSDISNILKLNDIPYRLTQGLSSDSLRLHNDNFDQGSIPTPIPGKLNQNVGSHQIDVTNSILNKLMASKQPLNNIRPDIDLQGAGLLSNINGFRVANPFNVDLKLVAEMLKGKPPVDESHLISLRDQYNKPSPIKLDMSSLQQLLLKNDNYGNLAAISDSLTALSNPYIDVYSSRYPYSGPKYSRSQEEEETIIPIAEPSNTHPIGAVIESEDSVDAREVTGETDLMVHDDESVANTFSNSRPKSLFGHSSHRLKDRLRHPNAILPGRHANLHRKYPKGDIPVPYPLLKPPPQGSRSHSHSKSDKRGRRRRTNTRPKFSRILKTEALFEADTSPPEEAESTVPTLLRPPPPAAAADKIDEADDAPSSPAETQT